MITLFLQKIEHLDSYQDIVMQYSDNTDGQEMISLMEINKEEYVTARGVRIGTSKDIVIKKYGACEVKPHFDEPTDLEYMLGNIDASQYKQPYIDLFIIKFKFKDDKVNRIIIESYYEF